MRVTIWIVGALFVVAGEVASFGCGGDDVAISCEEGGCECRDRDVCVLNCDDTVPCEPTCLNFGASCTTSCLEQCRFECRGGNRDDGLCSGVCGDDCDVLCSSVGSCAVETGARSNYDCVNTKNCGVEVGDDSTVRCTSVANCSVRCLGSCNMIWINEAMSRGIDGVIMVGCVSGDDYQCHYIKGSELMNTRGDNIKETLQQMSMENERVQLHQVEITDYQKVVTVIDEFMEMIEEIGMNPFKGM